MKKYLGCTIFTIIVSFIFCQNVYAECSYQERKDLLNATKNVEININSAIKEIEHEIINPNNDELETTKVKVNYFQLQLTGITDEFFAIITNNYNDEEEVVNNLVAKDGIYPDRELTLKFTLNNERPEIVCSLKTGESTTKSFTISFNEAVIYDQVGESYIYINNKLVAHITEDSLNKEQKIKTTYKDSGDGDYYVKLVSSSGVVLDSYKVTINEPLNTWAIIVIVVLVGVVLTVAITIIVLRRKMRIR